MRRWSIQQTCEFDPIVMQRPPRGLTITRRDLAAVSDDPSCEALIVLLNRATGPPRCVRELLEEMSQPRNEAKDA
jgi:hypothetical protein